MVDIINDTATITTIPKNTLLQLEKRVEQCITSAVYSAAIISDDTVELDIGIGILIICWSEEEIRYKFIPGKSLEASVTDAIVDKKCDLIESMEKSLTNKIINVYKELFK